MVWRELSEITRCRRAVRSTVPFHWRKWKCNKHRNDAGNCWQPSSHSQTIFPYSDWIYVEVWTCCVRRQWLFSVVSKQVIPSLTSLAAACGFLSTSDSLLYSFGINLMPVVWQKARPKGMVDLLPMYLQESNMLGKNSREKFSLFLGRFLHTM